MLALPRPYQDGLARAIRGSVLLPVFAIQQSTSDREGRFADPARLRAERDSLAVYLVGQANLAAENRQLRAMLGIRQRLPYTFVPAEIQRLGGVNQQGAFRLTAGARQGVQPGAAIIAAGGLVGSVRDTDAGTALSIDWTHTDFRASAMTTDGQTYGIVEPRTLRSGEPVLALTGTASHTELKPGTLVVTSGQGGVYPRGIPIGRVIEAEKDEQAADWRRSYLIRPLVSPAAMDYVLVLGPLAPGRGEHDLAAAWGVRTETLKLPPAPVSQVPSPQLSLGPLPPAVSGGATTAAPPPAASPGGTPVAARTAPGGQPPARGSAPAASRPAPRSTSQPRVPLLGTPVARDTSGAAPD